MVVHLNLCMHSQMLTARVRPKEHADKNKKGLDDPPIMSLTSSCSSQALSAHSLYRPKQDPDPRRIRTEKTLAANRVVLI